MPMIQNPQTGQILERRGGKWVDVTDRELAYQGGQEAAKGTGAGEAALVGAGTWFQDIGRGAREAVANLVGNRDWQSQLAQENEIAKAREAGMAEAHPIATAVGAALPGLATLPLGMGIGGAATGANAVGALGRVAAPLVEQMGISAAMGAAPYGAGGFEALQGAGLSGAGFGVGMAVPRVVSGIKAAAGATRARMAAQAAETAAGRLGGEGGAIGAQVAGEAGGVGNIHLGQATEGLGADTGRVMGALGIEGAQGGDAAYRAARNATAERLGLELTPAARSGDRVAGMVEASLESSPWSAAGFERIRDANQKAIDRLAARAVGVEAERLTPQALNSAHQAVEQTFTQAARNIGTVEGRVAQQSKGAFEKLAAEFGALPDAGMAAKYAERASKFMDSPQDAGRLMAERARVNKLARDSMRAGGGGAQQADDLYRVVNAYDELFMNAADRVGRRGGAGGGALRADLSEARDKWRVLMSLEKGQALTDEGGVRAISLATTLRRDFPLEYRLGRTDTGLMKGAMSTPVKDLLDATRVLSETRSAIGNSGTATRMALTGGQGSMVTNVAMNLARRAAGEGYLFAARSPGLLTALEAAGKAGTAPQWESALTKAGGLMGRL